MSIVIVTQNQYILASKIHHIVLNENYDHVDVGYGHNRRSIKELTYNINILYVCDQGGSGYNNATRDELKECNVSIRGKVNAHKVFRDLIRQIREQMPDQLFLDKALEGILSQSLDLIEKDEQIELKAAKEFLDDRSPKKVRRVRKTKGTGKTVLRKTKRSNRSAKK